MSEAKGPQPARRQLAAERAAARKAAAGRQKTRRYWLVGGIAAALVVVAVVLGAALLGGDDDGGGESVVPPTPVNPNDPVAPVLAGYAAGDCPQPAERSDLIETQIEATTPDTQADASAQLAAWDADCGLGEAMPDQGRGHIDEGEPHEPYNSTPPTSGPHYGFTVPWGVSSEPIPPEVQVHNLEHGGVLLQYNCDCPEAITLLQRFADPETGYPTKVIVAPYPDMPTEIALSAWGRIWTMSAAELTVDRVRAFLDGYVDRGPELIPSETDQLEAWRESDDPKP
jgi:hypothetical protein